MSPWDSYFFFSNFHNLLWISDWCFRSWPFMRYNFCSFYWARLWTVCASRSSSEHMDWHHLPWSGNLPFISQVWIHLYHVRKHFCVMNKHHCKSCHSTSKASSIVHTAVISCLFNFSLDVSVIGSRLFGCYRCLLEESGYCRRLTNATGCFVFGIIAITVFLLTLVGQVSLYSVIK